MSTAEKVARLNDLVMSHAPMVVAYSGGVDSTCLLALAHRTLKDRVIGVIADSPSLPRRALGEALDVAQKIGVRVEVVTTGEFQNEAYLANPANRCYFCKSELFSRLESLARERGMSSIAYGENADDLADQRPGSLAAKEFSVLAPLKLVGLTKAEVREISRELGLYTHDAPAQPCLSSRIPHGTRVTPDALSLVERGEEFLHSQGFRVFRVRYVAGPPVRARVQIAPAEIDSLEGREEELSAGILLAGFESVEFDRAGYRSP